MPNWNGSLVKIEFCDEMAGMRTHGKVHLQNQDEMSRKHVSEVKVDTKRVQKVCLVIFLNNFCNNHDYRTRRK
jgi:hypothetical protein